jgi:hypothetical protein
MSMIWKGLATGLLLLPVLGCLTGCGGEADEPAAPAAPAAKPAAPVEDPAQAPAAKAWNAFRDAFVRKEWNVAWDLFTPASQGAVEARFQKLRREIEGGSSELASQLDAMGIRPEQLREMDAKAFFVQSMRHLTTAEHLRSSWEKLKAEMGGSRVTAVRTTGDEAVLIVRDGTGKETQMKAARVRGAWRVNFEPAP